MKYLNTFSPNNSRPKHKMSVYGNSMHEHEQCSKIQKKRLILLCKLIRWANSLKPSKLIDLTAFSSVIAGETESVVTILYICWPPNKRITFKFSSKNMICFIISNTTFIFSF